MGKYVLKHESLSLGDIVLTKEKKMLSKAIRIATKGDYSHAMIVFREGAAVEADKRGVNSTVINRHIFKNTDDAIVLRNLSLTQSQQKAIVQYCSSQVGNRYSYKEAFWACRPKGGNISKKQFCSRLVSRAYMNAGIPLSEKIDFCTPADLQKSDRLVSVEDCMSEASKAEIAHAATPDPSLDQSIRTNKFMKKVWSKYPDCTYYSIWLELKGGNFSKEFDCFVAKAFQSAGLHELWKVFKSYKSHLYDVNKFIAYCDREIDLKNQDANCNFIKNRSEFCKSYANHIHDQIVPTSDSLLIEYRAMVENTTSKAGGMYLNNLKNQIEDWRLVFDVLEEVKKS